MEEHVGFRCEPSPCRGFPQKSIIRFFCEPGYTLPKQHHWSKCERGKWHPKVPTCVPRSGKRNKKKNLYLLVAEYLAQLRQSNLFLEVQDLCKRLEAAYADNSNYFILHHFSESSAFSMKEMC